MHPHGAHGLVPPLVLRGSGLLAQRLVPPKVADVVLGARQNSFGLRPVTQIGGVHFKRGPDAPAHEFAVDALAGLVLGEGTVPSELLRLELGRRAVTLQASRSVAGVNLRHVLDRRPELLQEVAPRSYSAQFLLALLTNPNDAKPENFLVHRAPGRRGALLLTGVDSDLAFADPMVHEGGRYYANVRCVFFALPALLSRPLDGGLRRRVQSLEPAVVLVEWLRTLHRQNLRYEGTWDAKEQADLHLPLRLRVGSVLDVYRKLQFIVDYLTLNPVPPLPLSPPRPPLTPLVRVP